MTVGFAAMLTSQVETEASGYRSLCLSSPGACAYASPNAPYLNADVCYDGITVTLKGVTDCSPGTKPFSVEHGEVLDPQTGEIAAYIALSDACDLGYCLPKTPGDPPGEPGAMCCDPSNGACTQTDAICPPDKIAVWCDDGEVAVPNGNGDWECHEAE